HKQNEKLAMKTREKQLMAFHSLVSSLNEIARSESQTSSPSSWVQEVAQLTSLYTVLAEMLSTQEQSKMFLDSYAENVETIGNLLFNINSEASPALPTLPLNTSRANQHSSKHSSNSSTCRFQSLQHYLNVQQALLSEKSTQLPFLC